jgi:hypothetical protein
VSSGQPTSVGPAARELVGKQQLFAVNISAPYEVLHRVGDLDCSEKGFLNFFEMRIAYFVDFIYHTAQILNQILKNF